MWRRLTVAELPAIGVKRISVGRALSRAALGACIRAALGLRDHGTFTFAENTVSFREMMEMLS